MPAEEAGVPICEGVCGVQGTLWFLDVSAVEKRSQLITNGLDKGSTLHSYCLKYFPEP